MKKQKFTKGFFYKTTTLSEQDRNSVLTFLNNQANATQSLHYLILKHIQQHGTGDLIQTTMLMSHDIGNAAIDYQRSITNPPTPIQPTEPPAVVPPTEQQGDVVPPTEQQGDVVSPTEQQGDVVPPTEQQGDVVSPTEQQGEKVNSEEGNSRSNLSVDPNSF